jgi:phage tail-like protein
VTINIQSEPVHYLPANRFSVAFGGNTVGTFAKVENVDKFTIGVMEIDTGDTNVVASQSAGKKKYTALKLTQGAVAYGNNYLRQWADQIVDGSGQNGAVDPAYKQIVTVNQLDRDGSVVDTWTYYESFISDYDGGTFDAAANEYRKVMVEITFRYNSNDPATI